MAVLTVPCDAQERGDHVENGKMHLSARFKSLLSPEELRGTCAGLTMTLQFHVERMKRVMKPAEKQLKEPSPSLFGGRPLVDEYVLERDKAQALNAFLDSKGCKTVNLEEALRDAASPETVPATKRTGKAGGRQ